MRLVRAVACGFLGCALLSGCSNTRNGVTIEKIETAADLKARLDAGTITAVDALDDAHYADGHIPGAKHCDYEKMSAQCLPSDKAAPLVFYCAGGMCPVSRMAAEKAIDYGYTKVAIYEGGIKGWKAAGMPVEKGTK